MYTFKCILASTVHTNVRMARFVDLRVNGRMIDEITAKNTVYTPQIYIIYIGLRTNVGLARIIYFTRIWPYD
jgi:hypothetical protein